MTNVVLDHPEGAEPDDARSEGLTGLEVLRSGLATSIGSLPHRDADAAAAFVLRHHPHLPAAPQLPRRSPLEGMIAQAARGMPGVTVQPDGVLVVDRDGLDPSATVDPPVDGASHAGLLAFLALAAGRTGPVKIQLTGPLTLGQALVDAGADPATAFAAAASAVRAMGAKLVALVRRRLPDAPLVAFLDEPVLVRGVSLADEAAIDLLSSGLAVLEDEAITGVHCCGPADWKLASAAGAGILALPIEPDGMAAAAPVLNTHLERGGWIAWGIVPTSEPVGTDPDRLWRRLGKTWGELAQVGCDPAQLRAQALVTPACGLVGHGISQAKRALELTNTIAGRVTQQSADAQRSTGG